MSALREEARWITAGVALALVGLWGDFVAEGFELGDEATLVGGDRPTLVEIVAAQIDVGLAGGERVPGDHLSLDPPVRGRDLG